MNTEINHNSTKVEETKIIKENLFTYETHPFNQKYKKEHKMSEEFKRQMDKSNPVGTKIVDTITGEVYITKEVGK